MLGEDGRRILNFVFCQEECLHGMSASPWVCQCSCLMWNFEAKTKQNGSPMMGLKTSAGLTASRSEGIPAH